MTIRAATNPLTLTTAEFSYLLSVIEASTVVGLKDDSLFLQDEAQQNRLWQEGRQALIDNKWMLPAGGANQFHLNTDLLRLVLAIATTQNLLTVHTKNTAGQKRGTHYYWSAEYIIELVQIAEGYQITPLATADVCKSRISLTLGLPEKPNVVEAADLTISLPAPVLKQVQTEHAIDPLIDAGLTKQVAESLHNCLTREPRSAIFTWFELTAEEVTHSDVRAIFWNDTAAWSAQSKQSQLTLFQLSSNNLSSLFAPWFSNIRP